MILKPTLSEIWAASQSRGFNSQSPELWRGLKGAWTFHEGQGETLYDVSGYRNHGTLTNMAPASDWILNPQGQALDFSSDSDAKVERASHRGTLPLWIPFTAVYTVSTAGSYSQQSVLSVGDIDVGGYEFYIYTRATDTAGIGLRNFGGGDDKYTSQASFPWNTLHTVVWRSAAANDHDVYWFNHDTGDLQHTTTAQNIGGGSTAVADDPIRIGLSEESTSTTDRPFLGDISAVAIYDHVIPDSQAKQLATDPYRFFRPRPFQVPVLTSVSGGTTGSIDQSVPAFTQSAAGTQTNEGAGDQTVPTFTQSASGVQTNEGVIAQSVPAFTQDASGAQTNTGSADQSLPAFTQSASGTTTDTRTGTIDQTIPAFTQSAAGIQVNDGILTQTLPAFTQSGAGVQTNTGSATQTVPMFTQTVTGVVGARVLKSIIELQGSFIHQQDLEGSFILQEDLDGSFIQTVSLEGEIDD